ncbi:hypothetical protein BST61_g11162 [Cercospora zeina]
MSEQSLHNLTSHLKSDHFVTINVGPPDGNNISVKIQQSVLEATSEWFVAALKQYRWLEGQTRTISFPEDDPALWSLFIHWVIRRELPPSTQDWRTMARCWLLGDKYNISRFQDICMARTMRNLAVHHGQPAPIARDLPATKTLILDTPPNCALMRLLGEEVALALLEGNLRLEHLKALDGTDGFWSRCLEARMKIEELVTEFLSGNRSSS